MRLRRPPAVLSIIFFLVISLNLCHSAPRHLDDQPTESNDNQKFTIQMIGYSPSKTDDYVAVSREAIPGYIVGFEPLANADRVHHMLLYGCTNPANDNGFWRGMETCGWGGGSYILYAWARNAPNLVLPKDVAFSIGHENDGIKYFVLQVHYAQPFDGEVHDFSGVTLHISQRRPANLAAVMLFVSGTPIPPKMPQFQNNITCMFQSNTPIHPFAFRTHTHAMGRVVSAFYKHHESWTKIGKRNPQWPQLFESIPNKLTISNGDQMSASCRFDSSDKNETVRMGAMGVDEMCNFYMMYFYDSNQANPYPQGAVCGMDQPKLMHDYPKDGFELLPPRPELEHHAHQSKVPFGIVEEARYTSIDGVKLGQVAGLAFDMEGNLLVFHRAGRVWGMGTFDNYNILLDKTPIADDVILVVSIRGNTSKIVKRFGRNQFYLPHGIYVDKDGYVYTTDVGAHTVAKWKIEGNELKKVWQTGELLMPGQDEKHFCKPTGITRVGDRIFVSDGYCNSRVVELGLDGKRAKQFGLPGEEAGQFNVPHDIVTGSHGHLIVSDRENGRVQEFTQEGHFVGEYKSTMFTNVYSADIFEDYVFMVPGRANQGHESEGVGVFVARSGTGLIEYAFGPKSRGKREEAGQQFGQPHALRISRDGQRVLIGDIAEGKPTLWQFRIQHEESSSKMTMSGGSYWPRVGSATAGGGASIVLLLLAALVLGVGFVVIRKRWRSSQNGGGSFDKKGFKPLRTEETVGFISDGSDSD